jgi:hypothetical protein
VTALIAAIRADLDGSPGVWPEPKALPSTLKTVAPFDPHLLPAAFRPWVLDIAELMQCPADYIAVSAIIAAGAVVGRRVGIRPQEHTDWVEVPNLWGCCVGPPGVMKSPAMSAALKPIRELEVRAARENDRKAAAYAVEVEDYKAARSGAKAALRKGESAPNVGPAPEQPDLKRYVVNDATYEALGEIMASNTNGVMAYRDELISMLKPLEKEENAPARGFFLSAWNGNEGYSFDRIMRGSTYIPACCLSLLGATQPAKISAFLSDAVRGGTGDDGFAQRLGLLVWPDVSSSWKDADRPPDREARRRAGLVFDRLDGLDPMAIGAECDDFDPLPYLRFEADAQAEFRDWRRTLEHRLRGPDLHGSMISHFNKYRGLVPKLALLFHLIDNGHGPVTHTALLQALGWVEYLETHAARAYGSVNAAKSNGARTLLGKIKSGALGRQFTARDVYDNGWSGLSDTASATQALGLLVDYDWLGEETLATNGRPKTLYTVNPRAFPA